MNGLPKEHREALLKIVIVLYLHEKFKCEPVSLPYLLPFLLILYFLNTLRYELTLPIKTEMASTEVRVSIFGGTNINVCARQLEMEER